MTRIARILLVALVAVAGCSAHRDELPPPPAELAPPPPAPAGDYRLQVGDQLDIRFYKTPELDTRVRIRPDGKITVQLVDEVRAEGLTPAELDAHLTEAFRSELREPRISVSLVEYGARRVYVGGPVAQPTMLLLEGQLTAFQAIQQAGGFADTAAPDAVVLIRRNADGKATGTEIDLQGVANGKFPERDIALLPQDILYVPRSRVADVNLFVEQYIRNNLPVMPTFGMGLGAF